MREETSPTVNIQSYDNSTVPQIVGPQYPAFFIGEFTWGPIDMPVLVSSTYQLQQVFGPPTKNTRKDFFIAQNYIENAGSLFVVRVNGTASKNSQLTPLRSFVAKIDQLTGEFNVGDVIRIEVSPTEFYPARLDQAGTYFEDVGSLLKVEAYNEYTKELRFGVYGVHSIGEDTENATALDLRDIKGIVETTARVVESLSAGTYSSSETYLAAPVPTTENDTRTFKIRQVTDVVEPSIAPYRYTYNSTVATAEAECSLILTDVAHVTSPSSMELQTDNLYLTTQSSTKDSSTRFVARYPGEIGSSLGVMFVQPGFEKFKSLWKGLHLDILSTLPKLSTSQWALDEGYMDLRDECHIVVYDIDGQITGREGTILETFTNLSVVDGASENGSVIYFPFVINRESEWISSLDIEGLFVSSDQNSYVPDVLYGDYQTASSKMRYIPDDFDLAFGFGPSISTYSQEFVDWNSTLGGAVSYGLESGGSVYTMSALNSPFVINASSGELDSSATTRPSQYMFVVNDFDSGESYWTKDTNAVHTFTDTNIVDFPVSQETLSTVGPSARVQVANEFLSPYPNELNHYEAAYDVPLSSGATGTIYPFMTPGVSMYGSLASAIEFDGNQVLPTGYSGTSEDKVAHLDTLDQIESEFSVQTIIAGDQNAAYANQLIQFAEDRRGFVFLSPSYDSLQGSSNDDIAAAVVEYFNGITRSEFQFADSTWYSIYDKFNNEYVDIPMNGLTAALQDSKEFPWRSFAGYQNGVYPTPYNIIFDATDVSSRNLLYSNDINPVFGTDVGIVLYGDKMLGGAKKAINRAIARRAINNIEVNANLLAKNSLFEILDRITDDAIISSMESLLKTFTSVGALNEYRVEIKSSGNLTNNREREIIIYVKPIESVNWITLILSQEKP